MFEFTRNWYCALFELDIHRSPPPTSATNLRLRLRPPTSTSDLRLRTPPQIPPHKWKCTGKIYGIVGARRAFDGIHILKYSCMWSSYSKFSKLAMFSLSVLCMYSVMMREMWNCLCSVHQKCKWGCDEEVQTGMFLTRLWADWQKYLHFFLSVSVLVTIESQW